LRLFRFTELADEQAVSVESRPRLRCNI